MVEAYLKRQVETLLDQVEKQQAERMEKEESFKYKVPLLRLKIEYSGNHSVINMARFGELFKHRIANRLNFLHFWRRSPESLLAKQKREGVNVSEADKNYIFAYNHDEQDNAISFFSTLEKLLVKKKSAVPHFSTDAANFKKLIRNCTEKNMNMETWFDNIKE